MGKENPKSFSIIFSLYLILVIILFLPSFSKAQGTITLNTISSDPLERCSGSVAYTTLSWQSTIEGTPTFSVLRKLQGEPDTSYITRGSTQNNFFTDIPIDSDKIYVYKIKSGSVESLPGAAAAPYCAPVISTPIGSSCEVDGPYIHLIWSAVSGNLSKYEVYRDGIKIGETTTINFDDGPQIEANKIYGYLIKAVWQNGGSSDSETMTKNAPACPPTLTVSTNCLISSPGGPTVNLSWNSLLGVQNYQIYRKTPIDAGFSWIATLTTETYHQDNLVVTLPTYYGQSGQIYYYVTAMFSAGGEAESAQKQIDILRCKPFLTVESFCQESAPYLPIMDLSWTATSGATFYKIFREEAQLEQYPATQTTFVDEDPCSGGLSCTNNYYIEAVVPGGNLSSDSVSGPVDCSTPPPPTAPDLAPLETFCEAGVSKIKLSWTTSENIFYYSIFRQSSGNVVENKSYSTPYIDPNIQSGIGYTYWITALGRGGTSVSNSRTIIAINCNAPSKSTLTLNTGCTNGLPYINLSWTETTNTLAYEIYRSNSLTFSDTPSLTITPDMPRTWQDIGEGIILPSKNYYYKIVAKGPPGVPSTSSDPKAIPTLSCLPTTPNFYSLNRDCSSGNPRTILYWSSDGANTAFYEIFRRREDEATFTSIWTTSQQTWTDGTGGGLSANTRYYYRIDAVGYLAGQRSSSNERNIVTYDCSLPGDFTVNEPPNISCYQDNYPRANVSWTPSSNSWSYRLYRYGPNTDNFATSATSFTDWGFGNALNFDGNGDFVELGNPEIPLTGDLTIEFWARPTDRGFGRQNPICKAYSGEFCLTMETDGSLNYFHGAAGGNDGSYMGFSTSNMFTSNNTWVHVVITRNMSTRTMRSYRNGSFMNSTTWSSSTDPSTSSITLKVGRGYTYDWYGTSFRGPIDEVRLYNRVLGDVDVQQHYQGNYGTETNLIGLWHFDENGTGQFVSDSSNYVNNGTLGSTSGIDTTDPTWVKNGLQSGSQYSWQVRAYGPGGNKWSTNTTASYPIPTCYPTKPGLVLTSFCETGTGLPAVTLNWSYSFLASSYEIHRQDKEPNPIDTVAQTINPSLRIRTDNNGGAGLAENTSYTYWIKAIGSAGPTESDHLTVITPSCLAPTKPNLYDPTFSCGGATNANPQVNLTWDASLNTTSYTIYREPSAPPFPVSTTNTSYTDTAVRTNTNYSYYVIASGPGGDSPPSDIKTINTGYCTPSTPTIKSLTTGCENSSPVNYVSWSDPDAETRIIFYDGFESGDFSKWSGTFQDDGITSVTSADPYQGTYHSQFVLNPSNNWDGYGGSYYDVSGTYPSLYLRAYYKFDSLPSDGYGFSFNVMLPAYWDDRSAIELRNQGGQYFWRLFFAGQTTDSAPFSPQINKWYSIELYTRVGTINGEAKVWIDEALKASFSGIDVSRDSRINQLWSFVYTWGSPGIERTFKIDSVIISDRYIGLGIYNADKYEIYRNTVDNSSTATLIRTIIASDPEFFERTWKDTDIALDDNQQYYYWVKSVGPTGLESALSTSKGILTYHCGIPSAPSLSYSTFCKNNLPYATLNWAPVPNAYSYNLYRNSSSIYPTRASPFIDKGSFALRFDGIDDYARIDNSIFDVDPGEVRTIEAWFKGGAQPHWENAILWKEGCCKGWSIFLYNNGDVRLYFNAGDASGCCSNMSWYGVGANDADYNDNNWHHVVGIIDRPNGILSLYIDGNKKDETIIDNTKAGAGGEARIGTNWDNSRPFNGIIDEVRIYGRTLTPTEISEHQQGIYKNETELLGAWHFEEGEGTTAFDSSTSGINGRIAGPVWMTGKIGGALEFGGLNGYVNIPDSNSLDLDYVTLSAWIYVKSYLDDQRIISKEYGTSEPYSIYTLLLSGSGERKIQLRIGPDGATRRMVTGASDVPLNQWVHVAGTFDGSTLRVYLNGQVDGTSNFSGTIRDNDRAVRIGNSEFYSPRFFHGLIDEVRIYNRALSSTEISEHKDGIFNNEDGLVGLWHFDEMGGTTTFDKSPFSNHGTFTPGAEWVLPSDAPSYVAALVEGGTYSYKVKAIGVGAESGDSNIVSFDAPYCSPAKPILTIDSSTCDFAVDPPKSQLILNWQADPNTQYWSIYRGRGTEFPTFLTEWAAISYTDKDVESGVSYAYYVIAKGGGTNPPSTSSDWVTKTAPLCQNPPTPPDITPPNGSVTQQCSLYNSRIRLDWNQTANTFSYNVLRKDVTAGETDFSEIYAGIPADSTEYTDSQPSIIVGHKYSYKVRAIGTEEGLYADSVPSSEVEALDCYNLPPGSPNIWVSGYYSTGDIVAIFLSWLDVGNAEYYKIFRSLDSVNWTNVTIDSTNPSMLCSDPAAKRAGEGVLGVEISIADEGWKNGSYFRCGLDDGQKYYYQVVAYNAAAPYDFTQGYPYGGRVSNIPEFTIPLANPGNFDLKEPERLGNVIRLTWDEAARTPTGGLVTYEVRRSDSLSFASSSTVSGCTGLGVLTCDDNSPSASERFYRVTASNTGNSGFTYSDVEQAEFPLPTWKEIPPW